MHDALCDLTLRNAANSATRIITGKAFRCWVDFLCWHEIKKGRIAAALRHHTEFGSACWARTSDLSVNSRTLCLLSYEGHADSHNSISANKPSMTIADSEKSALITV